MSEQHRDMPESWMRSQIIGTWQCQYCGRTVVMWSMSSSRPSRFCNCDQLPIGVYMSEMVPIDEGAKDWMEYEGRRNRLENLKRLAQRYMAEVMW